MVAIINNRDGKPSRTGKAGAAMKQHETQPSSGRIKICFGCSVLQLLLQKAFLTHISAISLPHLNNHCRNSAVGWCWEVCIQIWSLFNFRSVQTQDSHLYQIIHSFSCTFQPCHYVIGPITILHHLFLLLDTTYTLQSTSLSGIISISIFFWGKGGKTVKKN